MKARKDINGALIESTFHLLQKGRAMVSLLIIGLALFSLYSCSDLFSSCMEGNGVFEIESRVVTSFNKVVHEGSFEVRIEHDSTLQSVQVEGDENLLHLIETYVIDNILYLQLQNNQCIDSENEVVINITAPHVVSVEMSGSGETQISGFYEENFEVKLTGSGDIDIYNLVATDELDVELAGTGSIYFLSGKTSNANYLITGSGDIRADNLTAKDVTATITGSGDIYTYPLNHLYVTISGSGDVYYKGSPIISSTITGSGEVIKR